MHLSRGKLCSSCLIRLQKRSSKQCLLYNGTVTTVPQSHCCDLPGPHNAVLNIPGSEVDNGVSHSGQSVQLHVLLLRHRCHIVRVGQVLSHIIWSLLVHLMSPILVPKHSYHQHLTSSNHSLAHCSVWSIWLGKCFSVQTGMLFSGGSLVAP